MHSLTLVVPGRLETRTGGYVYDRRIALGLRDLGWRVDVVNLDDSFPHPTPAALEGASAALGAIPNQTTVVIDGLAGGAMPDQVEREADRLRLVALVHHPLAEETGTEPHAAATLEAAEARTLACARLVIVTSRATAAALAKYGVGADRVAVVEPGTDRAPLAHGSRGPVPQLLCVASLVPRKGHDTLFRALALIADRSWRLACVGSLSRDPATVERLHNQLRASGLTGRVLLPGEADEATLGTYYDHADIFVLPTRYEGYGMAVAEALARGLPVVSSPAGAIGELVSDGAGLLVPAGDAAALAAALSRVLDDPSVRERLLRGARLVRESLPGWDLAARQMAAALERVVIDEHIHR